VLSIFDLGIRGLSQYMRPRVTIPCQCGLDFFERLKRLTLYMNFLEELEVYGSISMYVQVKINLFVPRKRAVID